MRPHDPVTAVAGIGEKTAERLKKLDICCVGDLLWHLPIGYDDLSIVTPIAELEAGTCALVRAVVARAPRRIRGRGRNFYFEIYDETGSINVFVFNQPYLIDKFEKGRELKFYGHIREYGDKLVMDNPRMFPADMKEGLLPRYRLTEGIGQKTITKYIAAALKETQMNERFSAEFREKAGLLGVKEQLLWAHSPKNGDEANAAILSMKRYELLTYFAMMDMASGGVNTCPWEIGEDTVTEFAAKQPFKLTGAQLRAIEDVRADLESGHTMNRLVQGDVGSGKTVVAMFAAWAAVRGGKTALLMAPTEILARQHYESAKALFGENVYVLTGRTPKPERERIRNAKKGLIIGTHALLYDEEITKKAALAVTDEQHRFGVAQRAAVGGGSVHMLVMSATPIPRSMALMIYGGVGISVIDELPPGRKPVETMIVSQHKRADMYRWLKEKTAAGVQAYIVCPLIEASENSDSVSVEEVYAEIKNNFKAEMLHGRMTEEEKSDILGRFRAGETQVLVATTVIEVGIDVPNANVIIIESAHCYGLAQLHQLRGRVGRGSSEAWCCLVSDGRGAERLRALKATTDGYELAMLDMEQRGSGEMLGLKQHGDAGLRIASFPEDARLAADVNAVCSHIHEYPEDAEKLKGIAAKRLKNMEIVLN